MTDAKQAAIEVLPTYVAEGLCTSADSERIRKALDAPQWKSAIQEVAQLRTERQRARLTRLQIKGGGR